MKKALKRSLSILLAITIIFSSAYVGINEVDFSGLFAVKSVAASTSDLTFTLSSDGTYYSVSDCKTSASSELVIPATYNGLPVADIRKNAFQNCSSLRSVTIPDSVTSIGERAFEYCTRLTSITIPDSVTSIGADAFYHCESLTSITISDSVTSIGGGVFSGCTSLTSVTISDSVLSIGSYAFSSCTSLTSITIPDSVTSIGSWAFYNCTSLTSIKIPDSVTSIGEGAFEYCTSLTSITIPDSVTSIGECAFYNCTSLTSITIPDTVTNIGDGTFEYCTSLTSITIPDSVTSIGGYAFYNCTSLVSIVVGENNKNYSSVNDVLFNKEKTELIQYPAGKIQTEYTIPNSVTYIDDYAFAGCTSLTSITIPDTVTNIGDGTFEYCTSLASITIPDSVTSIGSWAFYNCTSLVSIVVGENNKSYSSVNDVLFNKEKTELIQYPAGKIQTEYTIPNSVTYIGDYAFAGCTSLTSITIPDTVTSIDSAFCECTSLTSIDIPDSVTSINGAFAGCTSLTSVSMGNSVTSIGADAFYDCRSLTYVNIPDSVTNIEYCSFGDLTSLVAINVDENNKNYSSVDGVLFNKDRTELLQYPIGKNQTEYTIPDGVKIISLFAFEGCASLTSIIIPDTVTNIEDGAFQNCTALTSIVIPDSVTKIGILLSFSGCTSLQSVTIESGVSASLSSVMFWGCTGLTEINVAEDNEKYSSVDGVLFNKDKTELILYPVSKNQTRYVIPNGVTRLSVGVFMDCTNLTSIVIPNSVKMIYGVFKGCTNLTSIVIPESVTKLQSNPFLNLSNDFTIYCYRDSYIMRYAIDNSLSYAIIDIGEMTNTTIDYENKRIYTTTDGSTSLEDIIYTPATSVVSAQASLVSGENEYLGTGSIVSVVDNGVTSEYTLIVDGDTNGDSVCDVLDVFDVERASNGNAKLDGAYALAGDSNNDNVIDITDYQSVVNKAVVS